MLNDDFGVGEDFSLKSAFSVLVCTLFSGKRYNNNNNNNNNINNNKKKTKQKGNVDNQHQKVLIWPLNHFLNVFTSLTREDVYRLCHARTLLEYGVNSSTVKDHPWSTSKFYNLEYLSWIKIFKSWNFFWQQSLSGNLPIKLSRWLIRKSDCARGPALSCLRMWLFHESCNSMKIQIIFVKE